LSDRSAIRVLRQSMFLHFWDSIKDQLPRINYPMTFCKKATAVRQTTRSSISDRGLENVGEALMRHSSCLRFYFISMAFVGAVLGIGSVLAGKADRALGLAEYVAEICSTGFRSSSSAERSFLAQSDVAMTRMMSGMGMKSTGDVDRDFVDMMVPHHQGAIDM